MNKRITNPPESAIWFLRHACPGDNEALAGDLIERFREGQTRSWFWKQVLIAFAVNVLTEIWRHWPDFCYAIAGTAAVWFLSGSRALRGVPGWLHWTDLPWPWDQFALELSRPVLLAVAVLPVLAAGLVIERSFRWVSLLRTGLLNLTLITFGHYSVDLFPWLLRPVPGRSDRKYLVIPVEAVLVLLFLTFLVAAWLGCSSARRVRESESEAKS
jgi:hypothetical protein